MADDGQRVALIEMDRAGGTRSSERQCKAACPTRAVRDALPTPTMAEFIPSVLWSLKPLDWKFFRSSHRLGHARRWCEHTRPHSPLLGLSVLTDHPTVVRSGVP